MRANNLWDANLVVVGQVLVIPGVPAAPVTSPATEPADPVAASIGTDPVPEPSSAEADTEPEATAPDNPLQPDLGILSASAEIQTAAVPESSATVPESPAEESEPPAVEEEVAPPGELAQPDLGIISPGAANWMLQPGIISTGDAATVREIFRRGQELGNNPHAFSKIGDCNSELPFYPGEVRQGRIRPGAVCRFAAGDRAVRRIVCAPEYGRLVGQSRLGGIRPDLGQPILLPARRNADRLRVPPAAPQPRVDPAGHQRGRQPGQHVRGESAQNHRFFDRAGRDPGPGHQGRPAGRQRSPQRDRARPGRGIWRCRCGTLAGSRIRCPVAA